MVGVGVICPFPLTERGNRYIFIFTDYLTRWVEAFQVSVYTADVVFELLVSEVVARHGCPRILLSDRGAELLSLTTSAISD